MKKLLCIISVLGMLMLLTACAQEPKGVTLTPMPVVAEASPETTTTTPAEPTEDPNAIIAFNDEVLEGLIRTAMNKPEGDNTVAEAEEVKILDLHMEGAAQIARVEDISVLKHFKNLENLNLSWCFNGNDDKPTDISVVAELTNLGCLYIACTNITDAALAYIQNLTNLQDLWIFGNNLTDIGALSKLTKLKSLWLQSNTITDISVLENMPDLEYFDMRDTQVTDITPLASLTKLKTLMLDGAPVEDLSPIKDIYPNLEQKDFEM